jgi:hypothetical protein
LHSQIIITRFWLSSSSSFKQHRSEKPPPNLVPRIKLDNPRQILQPG